MTEPIHTAKHVKNTYRKYQIMVAFFALVTIVATFLAAVSGVQISLLQKQMAAEQASKASATAAAQGSQAKRIDALSQQLATEKGRTQELLQKITALERQVADLKKPAKPEKPSPGPQQEPVTAPPASESTQPSAVQPPPQPNPDASKPDQPAVAIPQTPATTEVPAAEPAAKPAANPSSDQPAPGPKEESPPQSSSPPAQPADGTKSGHNAPKNTASAQPTPAPGAQQSAQSATPPAAAASQSSGQQTPVEKSAATA
jgi:hypothetical protein